MQSIFHVQQCRTPFIVILVYHILTEIRWKEKEPLYESASLLTLLELGTRNGTLGEKK